MHVSCIYSHHYRFVYVSTPKVACTSIKRALLPLLHEADMSKDEIEAETSYGNFHKYMRSTGVHMSKSSFEERLHKGQFENYYRFSFVRNPWDRLVSCYESKIVKNKGKPVPLKVKGESGFFPQDMTFSEFIRVVCDIPEEDSNVHFALQYRILSNSRKSADDYLVDYIGRYEHLSEDFESAISHFAPGRKISLEKWNISETRGLLDYRKYYDDRLAEMVEMKYFEDITRFGYSF
jgi:hypothetical protein